MRQGQNGQGAACVRGALAMLPVCALERGFMVGAEGSGDATAPGAQAVGCAAGRRPCKKPLHCRGHRGCPGGPRCRQSQWRQDRGCKVQQAPAKTSSVLAASVKSICIGNRTAREEKKPQQCRVSTLAMAAGSACWHAAPHQAQTPDKAAGRGCRFQANTGCADSTASLCRAATGCVAWHWATTSRAQPSQQPHWVPTPSSNWISSKPMPARAWRAISRSETRRQTQTIMAVVSVKAGSG